MEQGLAQIQLDLLAPIGNQHPDRELTFENRHQPSISTYLANTLVPQDAAIRITTQKRNYEQSHYEVAYTQGSRCSRGWLAAIALLAGLALWWAWRRSVRF